MTVAILLMIIGAAGLGVGDYTGSKLITLCALVQIATGFIGVIAFRLIDKQVVK